LLFIEMWLCACVLLPIENRQSKFNLAVAGRSMMMMMMMCFHSNQDKGRTHPHGRGVGVRAHCVPSQSQQQEEQDCTGMASIDRSISGSKAGVEPAPTPNDLTRTTW
jgi:hypothetical protein